jgi:hypothetical protein
MEWKPNRNANATLIFTGIKSSKVKPVPLAPFVKKTASSENFLTSSNVNTNALLVSTGNKPSKVEPAPPVPFVDKTVSSKDIYFEASDEKVPSEDIVVSEKTNEINSEVKPAPTTPPVYEMAPSYFLASTNSPAAASIAVPAAAVTVVSKKTYKTKSEVKSAPRTPLVSTPTPTKANVAPPALSVENREAPPSPSTPQGKALSLATAALAGIEKHGTLCQQIVNMMPTINTAYGADVSAVQSKISSMKDAQGSSEAALLGWEALRCEFRAMPVAAPRIIIETELFPGENNLFLTIFRQLKFLESGRLQIS